MKKGQKLNFHHITPQNSIGFDFFEKSKISIFKQFPKKSKKNQKYFGNILRVHSHCYRDTNIQN